MSLSVSKTEPAVIRGAIVAIIGLAASFGLVQVDVLSKTQIGYLASLIAVLLPIAQGLWTRYGVTPKALVVAQVTTDGAHVVTGAAAARSTGEVVADVADDGGSTSVVPALAVTPPKAKGRK